VAEIQKQTDKFIVSKSMSSFSQRNLKFTREVTESNKKQGQIF